MPGECAMGPGAASWQPCRGTFHQTVLSEEEEAGQGG